MKVYFVGAGPGDPELLTRKAARLLLNARCCIYAGSLVNPALLELLPRGGGEAPACELHDSAGMDLEAIIAVIRSCCERGLDVVRLHSGEPALYGAIAEQARLLDRLGIEHEQVPGISAFQAAAASLGVELTAPGVAQTVIITRTAGRTPMPAGEELQRLGASRATLCIYLSTGKLAEVCAELAPHYGADCPAALVYHASWPDERVVRATLADLPAAARGITRTAVILVGQALAGAGGQSRLYDPGFSHGYRRARAGEGG